MKKEKLRQRIIESAWQIVEDEGMDQLNVRKVASLSDCSLGSIYNSFGSFQDLQLHINAGVMTRLYRKLSEVTDQGISEGKTLKDIFRDMGFAYVEFGQTNRMLWKSLFEYFPQDPIPEWYVKHTGQEIYQICAKLSASFGLTEADAKQTLGFFWAAIHGVSAILLNKKMDRVAELFNEDSLIPYIEYCLNGLFKEANEPLLVSSKPEK